MRGSLQLLSMCAAIMLTGWAFASAQTSRDVASYDALARQDPVACTAYHIRYRRAEALDQLALALGEVSPEVGPSPDQVPDECAALRRRLRERERREEASSSWQSEQGDNRTVQVNPRPALIRIAGHLIGAHEHLNAEGGGKAVLLMRRGAPVEAMCTAFRNTLEVQWGAADGLASPDRTGRLTLARPLYWLTTDPAPPDERRVMQRMRESPGQQEAWYAQRVDGSWEIATSPPAPVADCDYLAERYDFSRASRILDAIELLSFANQRNAVTGAGPFIALFRDRDTGNMFPDALMIYNLARLNDDLNVSLRSFVDLFKDAPEAWNSEWYQSASLQAELRARFPSHDFNFRSGVVGIALVSAHGARATP